MIIYASSNSDCLVNELKTKIQALAHSPTAVVLCTDLRSVEAPSLILQALERQRGDDFKINILVNNAGVELNKALGNITPDDFASGKRIWHKCFSLLFL